MALDRGVQYKSIVAYKSSEIVVLSMLLFVASFEGVLEDDAAESDSLVLLSILLLFSGMIDNLKSEYTDSRASSSSRNSVDILFFAELSSLCQIPRLQWILKNSNPENWNSQLITIRSSSWQTVTLLVLWKFEKIEKSWGGYSWSKKKYEAMWNLDPLS